MVLIVGASCLYIAINFLPSWQKKSLDRNIIARPGLSFNNNCISKFKNLQHLLNHGSLNGRTDLIILHDILINSIIPHRTNNNTPQSTDELVATLKLFNRTLKPYYTIDVSARPKYLISSLNTEFHLLSQFGNIFCQRENRNLRGLSQKFTKCTLTLILKSNL